MKIKNLKFLCLSFLLASITGCWKNVSTKEEGEVASGRLLIASPSRPATGYYRHQNFAVLMWDDSDPGFNHDRYYIYRSETSGNQNFSADCEVECTHWINEPPECCKVTAKESVFFAFSGLHPNQTSYFVVRASDGTIIENDSTEKSITTSEHPSGMVLVDWGFSDLNGDPYKLYVDYSEAGCSIAHYDRDTGECDSGEGIASAPIELIGEFRAVPYVMINQSEARSKCEAIEIPGYGSKRLLTWKEFIVASSWVNNPWALTADGGNQDYKEIEDGLFNTYCNTNGPPVHPVTNFQSFMTASMGTFSTEACISYWGAQDMIGNVAEWVDDQVICYGDGDYNGYCLGKANNIDNAILGWGYCDDNGVGSCNYFADLPITIDGFEYTGENIQKLDPAQIIEFATQVNTFDYLSEDFFGVTSVSISGSVAYNYDGFWRVYGDSTSSPITRGLSAGGDWSTYEFAGRFMVNINDLADARFTNTGFRCALPVYY